MECQVLVADRQTVRVVGRWPELDGRQLHRSQHRPILYKSQAAGRSVLALVVAQVVQASGQGGALPGHSGGGRAAPRHDLAKCQSLVQDSSPPKPGLGLLQETIDRAT
jgi:hypothetical protein